MLLDSPGLVQAPDRHTFARQFRAEGPNEGVVAFQNLGRDAVLVVPSPRGPESAYCHLAAFIRDAPESQKHFLWRVVGKTVQRVISDRPLWVSTAGGGVAWVHIRLDSRPKYYGHEEYRTPLQCGGRYGR